MPLTQGARRRTRTNEICKRANSRGCTFAEALHRVITLGSFADLDIPLVENPKWCQHQQECEALNAFELDDNSGMCIGKLKTPADHGNLKGINDLSWCVLSQGCSRLLVNNDDLISFIILFASGAQRAGKPLPHWIAGEMEKFCGNSS